MVINSFSGKTPKKLTFEYYEKNKSLNWNVFNVSNQSEGDFPIFIFNKTPDKIWQSKNLLAVTLVPKTHVSGDTRPRLDKIDLSSQ